MNIDKGILCDVIPIIEKAAPLLASLFNDNKLNIGFGLLGMLVNCNPYDSEQLTQKLKSDPDLYAKLKTLENTHADWLSKI